MEYYIIFWYFTGSKSSIVEPLLEKERKYSVESKDSDVDSAKSSLPDTNGLLQDLHKDDSTDTLEFQVCKTVFVAQFICI